MKINYNPAAQNTLRHFGMNVDRVDQSMRNLSSGKKVVDGTDGGASLYVTTNMQNKVTGLKQAQTNTETSLSLLQTAEAAMAEAVDVLNQMKQLAVHAANEATNDSMLLEADQMEFEELLSSLEQKSERTTFAGKKLLNGSMGISGSVVGNHLRFVEAKIDTPGSPTEGFKIDITQPATRAMMQGPEPLSVSHLTLGFRLVIREGAKVAELDSTKGDLSEELQKIRKSHVDDPQRFPEEQVNKEIRQIIIHQLNDRFERQGLPLDAMLSPEGHIKLRHREFGDHTSFSATSSLPGVLTTKAGEAENSIPGKDVAGSIAGDPASGHGQLLTARPGTTAQGAVIEYSGEIELQQVPVLDEEGNQTGMRWEESPVDELIGAENDGFLHIAQQTQAFQIGASSKDFLELDLKDMRPRNLANGIENDSDFRSIADIDLTLPGGARDAIDLIDAAYEDLNTSRMDLGAFQKNSLENTLSSVKTENENLSKSISTIADTDAASEVASMAKNKILLQTSQSMLAQANQKPRHVLTLIEDS